MMKTVKPSTVNAMTQTHLVKAPAITQTLLLAGVIAGPLYLLVALIQALTRPGFDLLHHDVSLLSNGDLGWIQISNFLLSGLLVILGAIGWRQALPGGRAKTW